MSGLQLSPKYGVNPTIPVCFWCGEDRNEIAMLGRMGDGRKHEDFEAPMRMVLDYEPCEHCKAMMDSGFTVMEATTSPNERTNVEIQNGVFPTGRYMVLRQEAASRIFPEHSSKASKAFLEADAFQSMFSDYL